MACFRDYKAELIVRILAVLQFLLKAGNVCAAIVSLIDAWESESGSSSSADHECACVFKKNHCELIETKGDGKVSIRDPLFVVSCLWIGALNLVVVLRDLRRGTNRLLNSALFLLSGTLYAGLGDHYDKDVLLYLGHTTTVFALILLVSVPICGRTRPIDKDLESPFVSRHDDDEFGQTNGAFSSLE